MSMVVLDTISKRYGEKVVFDEFSLQIDPTKNTCILGKSGQGKTTLLHMVAGIEKATSGYIDTGELRFSFVFQEPNLLPWLDVVENIEYVLKEKVAQSAILEVLRKLSIEGEADSYPSELSGGMKQRVALARALLYPSDVVLMDEPFQNLDMNTREQSIALYEELLRERGVRVLFVSHSIDDAVRLADEVVVLRGQGNHDVMRCSKEEHGEKLRERLLDALKE